MPGKQWEEEESSSSSEAESSPRLTAVRRGKFEDEEEGDSDVLDSWDAAEDSEVEREKAKKAAEAKAKAEAAAAASKKPKAQRVAEHQKRRKEEEEDDESESDDETEAQRRERLRRTEKESDMRHAQDLFGDVPSGRKTTTPGAAVSVDGKDPNNTINLAQLPLFNPTTRAQFDQLRDVLVPILKSQMKTRHYIPFLEDLTKALAKDLRSEQIKGLSSKLTTLSNEKLKQEKAADKGGKKTKAAKTKVSLVANRPHVADVNSYDDAFGDDDFM